MSGVTVFGIQRRMMELGRLRMGEKGAKGAPKKLSNWRLTSASKGLLEEAALLWGGEVREWAGAPDEGQFELYTETSELPIILPPVFRASDGAPTYPFSQHYELWSGGGCQRRCDGVAEVLSGGPCMCDPEKRACDLVTRLQVMLPDVPGIGVWRLDTGGFNAAIELPAVLDFLAQAADDGRYVPAVLRLEQRSSKIDGQTRRYAVPVIDLPNTRVRDMLDTSDPQRALDPAQPPVVNPPVARSREKPALEAAATAPADVEPLREDDGFGAPPALPDLDAEAAAAAPAAETEEAAVPPQAAEESEQPTAAVEESPDRPVDSAATGPGEGGDAAQPVASPDPASSDDTTLASDDERRSIFAAAMEHKVPTDKLREIVKEIAGVTETSELQARFVEPILAKVREG